MPEETLTDKIRRWYISTRMSQDNDTANVVRRNDPLISLNWQRVNLKVRDQEKVIDKGTLANARKRTERI